MEKGVNTQEKIFSQTKAWTGALLEVDRKINIISNIDLRSYKQILFTGCGSTYYLSQAAAALF